MTNQTIKLDGFASAKKTKGFSINSLQRGERSY